MLEEAERYARRAIDSDPKLGEPYVWLSYVRLRRDDAEGAYESAQRAVALQPTYAFAPYFSGCAKSMSRDLDEAIPHFRQTLQIDPANGFAWLGLGWAYHELGQTDEAVWCLGKAVEQERSAASGSTAGVAGFLAECLRVNGDLERARRAALEGMASAERSDHMYRDTFRVICLVSLGRTALRQRDLPAARTAFQQAVLHIRGRPRALGGGHLLVQALAGLAQAGGGAGSYEEALATREAGELNFSWFWICQDDLTALELSRAARAVGRLEDARRYLKAARAGGSRESLTERDV